MAAEVLEAAVESSPVDTGYEAPDTDSPETDVEDVVETADTDSSEAADSDSESSAEPKQTKGTSKSAKMPAHLSQHLTEIQESNPQLYKDIKQLYFANQALRQQFPGGVQEAQKLKQVFEQAGGEQGLQSLQQDINFYNQLDQKWINADPSIVDGFAQSNPQSYVKLMPTFMERFAQIDQEAYGRTMSRVMINTINQAGVANALYLAQQQIQNNPGEASKLLTEVQKWLQGVDQLAQSQPKAPQQDPLQQQRQQLQQERYKLYNQSIQQEVGLHRSNSIKRELSNYLNGKQISPEQTDIIEERVNRELQKTLQTDQAFNQNLNKYYTAGDRDGVMKLMKSRIDTAMPDAVKKIYGILFSGQLPNKAKKTTVEPQKGTAKPAAKPSAGWVKLSKQPKREQIDYSRSDIADIGRGRAILKDGRKVTW